MAEHSERVRHYQAKGLVDRKGEITRLGELYCENRIASRRGDWQPDNDDGGRYGYEPDPYPGGSLI